MKLIIPLILSAGFCIYLFGQNTVESAPACIKVESNDSIYKGQAIDFLSEVKMANPNDLLYKVDQRFVNHIQIDQLQKALTLEDIYPKEETEKVISYSETELSYYTAFGKQIITAEGKSLSPNQLAAISTLNISSTFFLKSYVKYEGEKFSKELFYAFSVVPESNATYTGGYDQLIEELKENCKVAATQIKAKEIPLARVKFRISEEGKVIKSEINSYSGNLEIDSILVNSVKNLKENWTPATNHKGEKVAQDLFFFFGMEGC